MTEFEEIREKIGKDLTIKLPKANKEEWGEITYDWKFSIVIEWYIHQVADKYRTNELSKIDGRYTVINYSREQKGRIYINVHNYIRYIFEYLGNIYDFDFVYVWDDWDKKLIVAWEYERENENYRMNQQIADIISRHSNEDITKASNVTIV